MNLTSFAVISKNSITSFQEVISIHWSDVENTITMTYHDTNSTYQELLELVKANSKLFVEVNLYTGKNRMFRYYDMEIIPLKVTNPNIIKLDYMNDMVLSVTFKIAKSDVHFVDSK